MAFKTLTVKRKRVSTRWRNAKQPGESFSAVIERELGGPHLPRRTICWRTPRRVAHRAPVFGSRLKAKARSRRAA